MHPEIEKLIEMALADGQVTEKEREIILRKAEKIGLDVDVVEMYLEGKIGFSRDQQNLSKDIILISDEVKIGNQIWMTKNLNLDKFRNGDTIPYAKYDLDWIEAEKNKKPAYGYYDNNPNNESKYGKIYNWYAVIDKRGLAPEGWELPSNKDWEILINELGGEDLAGEKMKATSENWADFGFGDNSSGLTVEPGGYGHVESFALPKYEIEEEVTFTCKGYNTKFFSTTNEIVKNLDWRIKMGREEKILEHGNIEIFHNRRSIENLMLEQGYIMYIRCFKNKI